MICARWATTKTSPGTTRPRMIWFTTERRHQHFDFSGAAHLPGDQLHLQRLGGRLGETGKKYGPPAEAASGLNINATRLVEGRALSSNYNSFPVIGASRSENPVTFPPGRASVATKPEPTGSTTFTKMIGIVLVSQRECRGHRVECASNRSGRRSTNSFANTFIWSTFPVAQRTSIRRFVSSNPIPGAPG